jgi:FlaA1/EpsC-like NDP-sugar epimerase
LIKIPIIKVPKIIIILYICKVIKYSFTMFEIQNKVAVVTGGGGVLGSNISKGLLQAGAKVIILDIREEVLE